MKTTAQKRVKAFEIMKLAMLLNDTETKQEITGNKPTVFVEFSGHVNALSCRICLNGWHPHHDSNYDFSIFFLEENCSKELDECIDKLTELCKEWGVIK